MPEDEFPGPEQNLESNVPTQEVKSLKQSGLSNEEILRKLKRDGYTATQISEAINQADIMPGIPARSEAPSKGMQPSIMGKEGLMPEAPEPMPAAEPEEAIPETRIMVPERPMVSMPVTEPVQRGAEEQMQELAEAIVNEKWEELMEDIGDIGIWKEKVKTEVTSIKQEILRLENRFENLQRGVTGKVAEYGKGISDVGTEIKALEKVLQKLLQPLTINIKELSKITNRLKK